MIRGINLPIVAFGIYFFLLLLFGCQAPRDNKPEVIKLNDIELSDLKSQPIDQSQLKGKIVFVNFWATWCLPYRGRYDRQTKLDC